MEEIFDLGTVQKLQKAMATLAPVNKPKLHEYEGTCFVDTNVSRDTLDRVRDFQARKDDVFIVTYPKAGTTWAQEIMYLAMNGGNVDKAKKSHTMFRIPYVELNIPQGQMKWFRYPLQSFILLWCIFKIMFRSFLFSLRQGKFSVPDNYDLIKLTPSPRLLKSHLPAHLLPSDIFAKKSKIVYVARNPKDLAVSFFHFHKWVATLPQYESWDQFFDDFMAGKVTYGKWYKHVLGFWKRRNEDNILFLFYEDMKKDEKGAVRQICEFLGYHYSDDVIDRITQHSTFGSMKKNPMTNPDTINDRSKENATFMRKGVVGDWRNYFSEKQNEALDAVCDEKLSGTGLQFKFEILNNNNDNNN